MSSLLKYLMLPLVGFLGASLLLFEGAYIHVQTPYEAPKVQVKKNTVGAYVINLDRSKDRFVSVKDIVAEVGYPYKRISAVEGAKLTKETIDRTVDLKTYTFLMGQTPKKGTLGCSLSHVKVWEDFLASDYEYALVFEDDVRFEPGKLRAIVDELVSVPHLWDVNFFEISHRGMPRTVKKIGADGDHKLSVYLTKVSHTGCYIINRKAAQILREHVYPIKMPIDHFIPRGWEFDLKFTGVEPRIVTQSFGDSEIMATKNVKQKEKVPLISYMARGIYTLKSEVSRFVYAYHQYFTSKSI